MYLRPSRKLMERSITQGESFSTLRWWSVAANRCESFKQIDGQVDNRTKNCFYFAMMIRCWKKMRVLQRNWWTGREQNQKMFLLCDVELLPLIDVRPLRKLMDRSRTEEKLFLLCHDDPFLKTDVFIYLLKLVVVRLHIQFIFKNFHTSFFCFVVHFLSS